MKYAPEQGIVYQPSRYWHSTMFVYRRMCVSAGYVPVPQYMEKKMRSYPMFHDSEYSVPDEVVAQFSPHVPMALP